MANSTRSLRRATCAAIQSALVYSLEVPLLRDVKRQMPQEICELMPLGISRSLIVNRDVPPFACQMTPARSGKVSSVPSSRPVHL